jgi:hypothetical protein
VSEEAAGYIRPVRRMAVRWRRIDGTFAYGILICSLSIEQVLTLLGWEASQAADPTAVLLADVTFYDQCGGGIETSFKGNKQGLGLTIRNKKRFEAQYMLALLGSLAHNVVVWGTSLAEQPKNPSLLHLAYGARCLSYQRFAPFQCVASGG